ncbi:MAG TPA: type IV pilus assembly protein PilM [Gemmatimonadales bacterium]|nr:type IV pilus assembly protein PilM [Gemmatimonadales bacterium]
MALFGFGGKKTTVGLDIGSGLIKMCLVSHSGGEPTLTKVAFATVSDDAIVEGEVIDAGVVADAIRELLASHGVKQKDAVIAIGGRDVIIKKISMDRMSEDDAREVIRWEAEQHVPFDMENVELDFQILDPDGEGLQMTVLLVAAKRELIEGRIGLLAEAGLDAKVIDVDAFALHNAFELNHPDDQSGIVGLVNIGHETTNINILEDGVPVLTRDMPLGTRRLREDLQRERGVSVDEAEAMLRAGERNEMLDPFVASRGEELAIGIERAAAFLQSSSRSGGQIRQLFLVGGGARVPGLAKVLSDRLRVPVELANPLGRLNVADGVFDEMNMDEVAPLLMLPIGLALRTAA